MSLRDDLAGVLARDSRFSIQAYVFVFESLEFTKKRKLRAGVRGRKRPKASRHVSGRELCEGVREFALNQFGLLALTVLSQWGIHSTSNLGDIVYNLIASGDLEKTPTDSRVDFNDVYNFQDAFRRDFVVPLDEVA